MVTLTVCALAHNVSSSLNRFFTCLDGLADQVLIGDLGSTDNTAELARSKGAQVVSLSSAQDYAKLRNALLSHVTSEWVLVLDCHETISNPSLQRLKFFLEDTDHEVFILPIRNYTNEKNLMGWRPSDLSQYEGYIPSKQARLFRNNSVISFSYPVHETIMPSLTGKKFDVKEITDISIHNYNYAQQLTMIYKILKELKASKPEDLHVRYNLGLAYLRRGRLESAKKEFSFVASKVPTYKNVLTNLATIYLKEEDHFAAAKLFLQAIEHNPKDLNAYHNLGQLFWQQKNYDKAEYLFQKALTVEPREPRLIIALSQVYQDMGKDVAAKELLDRSLVLLPKNKMLENALKKMD